MPVLQQVTKMQRRLALTAHNPTAVQRPKQQHGGIVAIRYGSQEQQEALSPHPCPCTA